MKPTPKVAAAWTGSGATLVLVWAASLAGVDMPAEVAVALCGVISGAAAWIKS